MARPMSPLADLMSFEVLREMDLLPQLYQTFLDSNNRAVLSLPCRNFSRSISFHLLSHTSEFYCAFLRHTEPERKCTLCLQNHDQRHLCLPETFETEAVHILCDMLEWKLNYLTFQYDLVSLVRLCGYLLIKPNVVNAFLVYLLDIKEVRNSKRGPVFTYELYQNGFLQTAQYFAEGVDCPNFYDVLKENESYRNVKRKVRNYQRYRVFAPTYTYPNGTVKFSRVRAGFFWHYYDTPPIDYDDESLGIGWNGWWP